MRGATKERFSSFHSPEWIYRRIFWGAGIHCLFGFASEGMKCGPAPYCHDSKPAPKSHNQVNTFISQQLTTSKRGEKQVEKSVEIKTQDATVGEEFFVAGLTSAELIGEEGLVVSDGVHRFEYAGDAFALGHVSARARRFRDIHHACAFVHG